MNIVRRSFSFGIKKSKNFNSVDIHESMEVALDEDSEVDAKEFNFTKEEMIRNVKMRVDRELDQIKVK